MDAAIDTHTNATPGSSTARLPRPRPNRTRYDQSTGESPSTGQRNPDQSTNGAPRRPNRPPRGDVEGSAGSGSPGGEGAPRKRAPRRRPPKPSSETGGSTQTPETTSEGGGGGTKPPRPPGGRGARRGAKFNAGLTESSSTPTPSSRYRNKAFTAATPAPTDLTSTLIHALRTPPYPDCPICFSPIHPAQRTWSCSPSIPVVRPEGEEQQQQQYCWTTFHVKCIGEWAAKSVKDMAEAWRARGEHGKKGDWRCPGCQAKREVVPSGYWCFCNSTPEPKPPRLATPHSCGNPCTRPRDSGCGHPCPLACHPGPCPPCQVTTRLQCYCPLKKVIAFRCGVDAGRRNLSCGAVCGRALGCGKHACARICHEGPCGGCTVREVAMCWCGGTQREVGCGDGEEVACVDGETGRSWTGRFECHLQCQRLFDCGIHKCEQACHPPHTPTPCPFSPANITHCPCGTHPIGALPSSLPPSTPTPFPPRAHCTSPIPTCSSPCSKPHPSCGHLCIATCHTGPCPPCTVSIVRPCRCGATTRGVRCFELHSAHDEVVKEILCDKLCNALRACGRHQCRRVCCPLASLAAGKKGRKRGAAREEDVGVGEERGGLHECDLVCGKMLGCGNHRCEERDHRGACGPCLRSSFEELICPCGRTILDPPIPCGTQLQCNYPCQRPPPPCGHPHTLHMCHEARGEESVCPPCPFLTTKGCACGKKMVGNVRCSLDAEKVSCGSVCGKLMTCGFHHCERLCHAGECGACTAPCGKSRKHCLPQHHPCPLPCHAPSTCPEDTPCQSLVTLTCPCSRIRQSVHCGRSSTSPSGSERAAPKCNNECAVAKRNARLAEALGITPETREKGERVVYHEEVLAFGRANAKFVGVVEKAFEEFVVSGKKTQVLPHMPPERRKFVHDLAAVYRMDTQMVDQEPHRSVRLLRRLDTRIPTPLVSSVIAASTPAPPSLGKLADLRAAATTPSWRAPAPPKLPSFGAAGPPPWAAAARPTSAAAGASRASGASGSGRLTSSAGVTRASTPTPAMPPAETTADVPDSWEDDV